MGEEVPVDKPGVESYPENDKETGDRLDFLFALQPSMPAKDDELLIVEIKRDQKSDGSVGNIEGSTKTARLRFNR